MAAPVTQPFAMPSSQTGSSGQPRFSTTEAAIADALSNREEIVSGIEEEDRLEQAARPAPVPTV
jgi:hypothetical protein